MVKTVVREHHWSIKKIDRLYLDDIDHNGLMFWYDDVCESVDEIKGKGKK